MNIVLPDDLERFVRKKVKSGEYLSTSEVIHHGLWLLQERDVVREYRGARLRKDIALGLEQIKRGEAITLTTDELPQYFESFKKRARARLQQEPVRKRSTGNRKRKVPAPGRTNRKSK